eukprot:7805067-Heterocapsa_arctica.AAC.1
MVSSACHVPGKVCMPGTNSKHFVSGCTHERTSDTYCCFLGTTDNMTSFGSSNARSDKHAA